MDSNDQTPLISRRTLARGAAWTAPTVIAATAAPAIAASPVSCPTMPIGASWVRTASGTVNTAPASWSGSRLQVLTDANRSTGTSAITFTTTVPVQQGYTYGISFTLQTAKGYMNPSSSCTTVPTQFRATATTGSSTVTLANATTATGNPSGLTSVAPPVNCTTGIGNGVSQFGSDGTVGTTKVITSSFTATTTGSMTLTMVFSLPATTSGNNDDWRVTPAFTTCSR
ncbi:hypothetical protein NLU66_16460 [Brachybacterium sp. NBEC-018]|uniref:hypothetical protein n=1 Tax=Brachybacterium sp. NBEC-018 TaxID=2996004 RepID=UPI0021755328|nr:hypothetical protein [Brachybacterium sp. NBEC-018]UVY83780.1 hypothetical protein NLU66_16460 [Brachybacterium sp. NBEC-018]